MYGKTYDVLNGAYAAMVTSGTATLETALFKVPQIVCYKMPLGWIVSKLRPYFIKVKYISLVNLIANGELVPELVADGMNVNNIRKHLLPLLSDTAERKAQLDGYDRMSETLGGAGASIKAAATESFGYNTDEIVSSDVLGMKFGSLFDATQTMVSKIDDDTYQVQVVSWYDNENSYTSQMVRTIKYFAELN